MLTADELLAGGELTFDIVIPQDVLSPAASGDRSDTDNNSSIDKVKLKPLTIPFALFSLEVTSATAAVATDRFPLMIPPKRRARMRRRKLPLKAQIR